MADCTSAVGPPFASAPGTGGCPLGRVPPAGTPAAACVAAGIAARWFTELAKKKPMIKPSKSPMIANRVFSLFTIALCVRVQPGEQIAHAEISEDDEQKSDDREVGRFISLPAIGDARVEKSGVGEPRDQCSDLFGVPSPVSAPRLVRPDGTGHQQQS